MQPHLLGVRDSRASVEYPELVGVGGWLWLFCFLVTIHPLATILETIIRPWTYWNVPLLCYSAVSALTGYSVWRMTPRALLFTRLFLITWFCLGALALINDVVAGTLSDRGRDFEFMIEAVVWFLYFRKSKRVKATFGRSI